MEFVDKAVEKYDFINEDKMGVTGGSYGGFMTNWIIGHTDRFKAAASQRSISNWISKSMVTDIGYYFVQDQQAGNAWTDFEGLWEQSPLKYANKAKTPTLFIHGDEDYRCYKAEAYQMFTALKFFGVESKFVLFDGENHELSRSGKPKHRIRRLKEITQWMDKYLK
jgi:dipeptidyl aminopeptidase/acylaminoacyl peptidase